MREKKKKVKQKKKHTLIERRKEQMRDVKRVKTYLGSSSKLITLGPGLLLCRCWLGGEAGVLSSTMY